MQKRDDNARVVSAACSPTSPSFTPRPRRDSGQGRGRRHLLAARQTEPHANGLRFLAAVGSTKDLEAYAQVGHPNVPLPKEGQQPPLPRDGCPRDGYVGWLKIHRVGVLERGSQARQRRLLASFGSGHVRVAHLRIASRSLVEPTAARNLSPLACGSGCRAARR